MDTRDKLGNSEVPGRLTVKATNEVSHDTENPHMCAW